MNLARKTLVILVLLVIGALVLAACAPFNEEIAQLGQQVVILTQDLGATKTEVSQLRTDLTASQKESAFLKERLEELQLEVLGKVVDLEVKRQQDRSKLNELTLTVPWEWEARYKAWEVSANDSFKAKIWLAKFLLEKGEVGAAKNLTLVLISELGFNGCSLPVEVVLRTWLPQELISLVEQDLSPLYLFRDEWKEKGWDGMVVRYQQGC